MIWEYLVQTVEADRVRMSGFAGTIPGVPDENLHNQVLNERGAEGWELVSVWSERGSLYFYFKRPKE